MSEATLPTPSVDIPSEPWSGRHDGDGIEHRRWWQAVRPCTPSALADAVAAVGEGGQRPAVLLGFRSDEGVRRNKGRVGAAEAPSAIRAALANLAFHLDRIVFDAGDVSVETGREDTPGELEGGQERCGGVITSLLDAGALTVTLGGGHETAFASYLGVIDSEATAEARVGILNLDAHFDLRAEDRATSGTPFLQMARAEAAAGRTLEYAVVGVSQPNNTLALFRRADELGVRYLLDEYATRETAESFVEDFLSGLDALYLTIDLDVLPAAVAPGVSAPAALGVPLDVVVAVVRRVVASGKLVHADIAELNPTYDVDARTARVAARLVDTILS